MATKTQELGLDQPGRGEFTDSWHIPLNDNAAKIDVAIRDIRAEIRDARGNKSALRDRLNAGMDSDGILLPTAEVLQAINSFVYGNTAGSKYFSELNDLRDDEILRARQGQDSLQGGIAYLKSFQKGSILTGSKNVNGEPSWAGSVANKVAIDGSANPLYLEIAGKAARIRKLTETDLDASPGIYYVYATWQPDGVAYLNPGTVTGSITYEGSVTDLHLLNTLFDATQNFVTSGVRAGDILAYQGGKYVVAEDPTDGHYLKIVGNFSASAPSTGAYTLSDPLGVVLGKVTDEAAVPAKSLVLVEATSDGASVTSYNARHFGDTYVGDWRAVDVSTIPTFEEVWNHRLGTQDLEVSVQVKLASDSEYVETLSLTKVANTLVPSVDLTPVSVGLTDSRTLTKGTLATDAVSDGDPAHSHTVSGSPAYSAGALTAALSGTPITSLAGAVYPENSVAVKYSRNQIKVKNAMASKLYRDYDGVERTTGFVRVIITKR